MNITISQNVDDNDYAKALKQATERAGKAGAMKYVRVRTKKVRNIALPEKVTAKAGDRVYGAERLRPVTNGHNIVRTFTFAKE
jgi:hypothetical protein